MITISRDILAAFTLLALPIIAAWPNAAGPVALAVAAAWVGAAVINFVRRM